MLEEEVQEAKEGWECRLVLMRFAAPSAALVAMHVVPNMANAGATAMVAPSTLQATGMARMLPAMRALHDNSSKLDARTCSLAR